MKTKITTFLLMLFSIVTIAQNGINYKAVIKDATGNIVAQESITVEFTIIKTSAAGTEVYKEKHAPTTDDNGIIVLNIGEGTVISGVFTSINWADDTYFLNVKADIGPGLTDLGTTEFKQVPKAYHSNTSINSEKILMFESGTSNPAEMIIQHSEVYPNWGLQYSDVGDKFSFVGGTSELSVALTTGNLYTDGKITAEDNISTNANLITEGNIGVGTQTPTSGLHVKSNSNFTSQNILIEEEGGDYARLGLKNTISTANWDIAGFAANAASSARLNFYFKNAVGGSNKMSITGAGNVGIGISNPASKLHVIGDAKITTDLTVDQTIFSEDIIFDDGSRIYDYYDGYNTGVRVTSHFEPSLDDAFYLGGVRRWKAVFAANGTIVTSDLREKTNISTLDYGLETLMKLEPVSFNWKSKPTTDKKLGLIAQDLLKVIPEVVKTHIDVKDEKTGTTKLQELDRMGVYYSDLIPVLIKAIQEQQATINSLNKLNDTEKTERQALQKNYLALLSRVEALESSTTN